MNAIIKREIGIEASVTADNLQEGTIVENINEVISEIRKEAAL
ncbi:hypothetical protein [Clostridium sp. FP1]|nr:hypothetical protein [Clostridium sp. FP1]